MLKCIAKGNTGEIYAFGDSKVCKLFFDKYPYGTIYREYTNTKILEQLGLPVVPCHEIIHMQNRKGIIYDRIYGETLLDYGVQTNDYTFVLEQLVSMHQKVLACQTTQVMNYKQFLLDLIKKCTHQQDDLIQQINQLPEGHALCHGDLHPGNLMIDDTGRIALIDCMNVCYGPKLYDIARTYFLISECGVPDHCKEKASVKQQHKQFAEAYVEKMGVAYEDIEPFLNVIAMCRQYE